MWNLYLAYSEGGFRAGYLDVHQLVLERSWGPRYDPAARSPALGRRPARHTLRR